MQMRKAVALGLDVLGLACLAGVYALDYFTKTRLGMTRWVNYNARALREAFPIDAACTALVLAAAVALLFVVARRIVKGGRPDTLACVLAAVSLACTAAAVLVCLGAVHTLAKPFTLVATAGAAVFALLSVAVAPWERRAK